MHHTCMAHVPPTTVALQATHSQRSTSHLWATLYLTQLSYDAMMALLAVLAYWLIGLLACWLLWLIGFVGLLAYWLIGFVGFSFIHSGRSS